MNNEYIYCSFWRRFGASVIDRFLIIVGICIIFASAVFFALFPIRFSNNTSLSTLILVLLLIYVLICGIIESLFYCSKMQGTPGKYWLGMKVINKKGERISFLRSLVRFLSPFIIANTIVLIFIIVYYFLALYSFPSSVMDVIIFLPKELWINITCNIVVFLPNRISTLLVIFTKEKTALHDLIAGTRVIRR